MRSRLTALVIATAAAVAVPLGTSTSPADAAVARNVPLTPTAGSANVREATDGTLRLTAADGFASLRPVRLGHAVARLTLGSDAGTPPGASVTLWVRAAIDAGRWSEWTEAVPDHATALPAASRTVQVRVALSGKPGAAGPAVRRVRVTPGPAVTAARARAAKPYSTTVFATREGLVGGTTANGHKIKKNDRFVALPSARALSDKGSHDYTVKVCTKSRCARAAVWDVGPWNVKDDYWHGRKHRQMWRDLPRGEPEAEAAYYVKYHKGKDASGRKVVNPSGIDLADGTFRKDLKLKDNAWVRVTYLWTGSRRLLAQRWP